MYQSLYLLGIILSTATAYYQAPFDATTSTPRTAYDDDEVLEIVLRARTLDSSMINEEFTETLQRRLSGNIDLSGRRTPRKCNVFYINEDDFAVEYHTEVQKAWIEGYLWQHEHEYDMHLTANEPYVRLFTPKPNRRVVQVKYDDPTHGSGLDGSALLRLIADYCTQHPADHDRFPVPSETASKGRFLQ